MFSGGRERMHLGINGLKKLFIDDCLIYFFTDWLCGLTLRLKDQNLNPLWTDLPNLFRVLIVSSTSFLQGCVICSLDSSSSFSSSPSVITSASCSENSETIYLTDNGRDWLVPSRKCTLNWVAASLLGLFLSNSFSASYFAFKVTYAFFCGHSEHNTKAIFFHALIFKTIKFKNGGKT